MEIVNSLKIVSIRRELPRSSRNFDPALGMRSKFLHSIEYRLHYPSALRDGHLNRNSNSVNQIAVEMHSKHLQPRQSLLSLALRLEER